jgi:hypothetical protein
MTSPPAIYLPMNGVVGRVTPCAPLPIVTGSARAERRTLPSNLPPNWVGLSYCSASVPRRRGSTTLPVYGAQGAHQARGILPPVSFPLGRLDLVPSPAALGPS